MATSQAAGDVRYSKNPISSLSRLKIPDRVAPMMSRWHRSKAKINFLLRNAHPKMRPVHESTCRLPFETVEMIISYLARDVGTLKACSLTCRSWHTVVVPHIHHTIVLKEKTPGVSHGQLDPLSGFHERGRMPLVKEIVIDQRSSDGWFVPGAFSPQRLRYFSAFANVQALKIRGLNISRFIPGIKHYFGHFSPTLRSITLSYPICSPRQLAHFLSLFPNLDDIDIRQPFPSTARLSDAELIPFSASKLRGQLKLSNFHLLEAWTHLDAACGGLRFRSLDLRDVADCAPVLLEACARTLESLRFYVTDDPGVQPLFHKLDLSKLKVLRSLEVANWATGLGLTSARSAIVAEVFSTITSPVFSELILVLWYDQFARVLSDMMLFESLRGMHETCPFRLVFSLHVWSQSPLSWERRRKVEGAIQSATEAGLLDFLDSPPTLRVVQLDPWE